MPSRSSLELRPIWLVSIHSEQLGSRERALIATHLVGTKELLARLVGAKSNKKVDQLFKTFAIIQRETLADKIFDVLVAFSHDEAQQIADEMQQFVSALLRPMTANDLQRHISAQRFDKKSPRDLRQIIEQLVNGDTPYKVTDRHDQPLNPVLTIKAIEQLF